MGVFPSLHDPASAFTIYANAAIGAAILWGKLGKDSRRTYALSKVVETLIPPSCPRFRVVAELAIFLGLGTYLTVEIFGPATGGQAFAAGMGWTAGVTTK